MIITSIALLVLAFVLLIVGIAKSGVAFLVLSSLATVVACILLYASYVHYRTKAILEGRAEPGPEGHTVTPGYPAAYNGRVTSAGAPGVVSAGLTASYLSNYEQLDTGRAVELAGTLNLDELHALRRFEVEHENRRTVLRAIDARINSIVSVHRSLSSAT